MQQRFNEAITTINLLDKQKNLLDAELKYKNEQLVNQKNEVEQIGKRFETEFKVLAQNILSEKTKVFNEQQEKSLSDILTPLKENLQPLKQKLKNVIIRKQKNVLVYVNK